MAVTVNCASLELGRRKGVAGGDRPLLEAGVEPVLPLLRAAMREAVGHDPALRPPLQRVVADRRRRAQRRLDIARLEKMPALVCFVGPETCQAIRLKLDPHLDAVCFGSFARGL